MGPVGPQIPGRRGLEIAIGHFTAAARWRNWPVLLDVFYLREHASEMKRDFDGDPARWFRASRLGAALTKGDIGDPRYICLLSQRTKHVSPRFDPHYVAYYRLQARPCREGEPALKEILAEGRMEWGYERKNRRWVHLRPLG